MEKDVFKIVNQYKNKFKEEFFIPYISKYAGKMGANVFYIALLFFYAFKRQETPAWAKNIIIGLLGYLVSPIDMIPDITPLVGYTDDMSILSFGLVMIAGFINQDIRDKARANIASWFPKQSNLDLSPIDRLL